MRPRMLLLALAVLACAACVPRCAHAADPKPVKVLLVIGGGYHDYEKQKKLLADGITERAFAEVTVVHEGKDENARIALYEKADWADPYDVVIHDECFAGVKDKDFVERILAPHKAGKPAVHLHCSMHSYRTGTDAWFEFTGVTTRRHGAAYPHEVLNRAGDHPVMKGWGPAWYNPAGELYWIEKVGPNITPLASSKNQENGKEEVCAWTHTYNGKARVFGTTLGHHNETVADPKYLDLVTRGTLWAAGMLDEQHLKTVKPKLVPNNLAAKAKATASTAQKENPIAAAFDGNVGSRWAGVDAKPGHWLQVDLGKAQKVIGARIVWEFDREYKYKVEASADGKDWRTVAEGKGDKAGPYLHPIDGEARYIKVTHLGNHWPSIRELEVHGTEMVPAAKNAAAEQSVLGAVKAADGFEVTAFAAPPAVNYPVFVSAAVDGTVYVSSDGNGSLDRNPRRGRILRLRDIDNDGKTDEVKMFVPDIDSPRGLVWDQDRLYVLHPPHISAYIDKDGDGIADEEKILVKNIAFGFKDRPADHTSNGLTLGIDGWLYAAIGDFGFMQAEGADGKKLQMRGGGVVRVRPDGTGLEMFSYGTRNILEVALSPLLDGFARDNTNDGGGWDVRFHHFTGLEDHGYPKLYKNFADEAVRPLADYGGGSGCGAAWIDDARLPAEWNNKPFTADWGRDTIYAHTVTPKDATYEEKTPPAEFVKLPRPTDLDVDGSGAVYVCSWRGGQFTWAGPDVGFLVRLTPKGYQPRKLPDFAKATDAELVKLLEDGSHRVRLEAQRRLVRRGLTDASGNALVVLSRDATKPLASRVAAVFAMKQGYGEKANGFLENALRDPVLAAYALRGLGDHTEQRAGIPWNVVRTAAILPGDQRVRREAVLTLARVGTKDRGDALLGLLGDTDPLIAHTAQRAAARLGLIDECLGVLKEPPGDRRTGAAHALALMHEKAVVDGLVALVEKDAGDTLALAALCRLYHKEGEWKGDSWGTRPDTRGPYYQPEKWDETERIDKALRAALEKADAEGIVFLGEELARNRVPITGAMDRLVELAKKDTNAIETLTLELAKPTVAVPPAAVPLLLAATKNDDRASRCAVIALAKIDSADGVRASLDALGRTKDLFTFLLGKDAFLASPHLGKHVGLLTESAAAMDGRRSLYAEGALLKLAANASTPDDARAAADKAFADGWKEPKRRAHILKAASVLRDRSRAGEMVAALDDPDEGVRAAAAEAVKLNELDPARVKAILNAGGPKVGTMKADAAIDAADAGKGEVWRGEQVFVKLKCGACHTVTMDQPSRGPYLGTIAKTYRRKALAEAILIPSKTLAQGFVTNVFNLKDGKTITGFVTQEAADKVTVRDAKGTEIVIPKEDIDERSKSPVSVMPEGLAADLTVTDLASLLDYLEALAAASGPPSGGGKKP